jgi:hypothetical protein
MKANSKMKQWWIGWTHTNGDGHSSERASFYNSDHDRMGAWNNPEEWPAGHKPERWWTTNLGALPESQRLTVRQLSERLAKLPPHVQDLPAVVWLPGSRIDVAGLIGEFKDHGEVLIEGNLRPGSALK